jgi:hypothetical protein
MILPVSHTQPQKRNFWLFINLIERNKIDILLAYNLFKIIKQTLHLLP